LDQDGAGEQLEPKFVKHSDEALQFVIL